MIASFHRAKRERLVAQAMTFFEQDQSSLVDIIDTYASALRQRIIRGHSQQKRIVEKFQRFNIGTVDRQRQHHAIEFSTGELVTQNCRQRFSYLEPKPGVAPLHARQESASHCNQRQMTPSRSHRCPVAGQNRRGRAWQREYARRVAPPRRQWRCDPEQPQGVERLSSSAEDCGRCRACRCVTAIPRRCVRYAEWRPGETSSTPTDRSNHIDKLILSQRLYNTIRPDKW